MATTKMEYAYFKLLNLIGSDLADHYPTFVFLPV